MKEINRELKIGDLAIFPAKEYTYSPPGLSVALHGQIIKDCRVWKISEIYKSDKSEKRLLKLFNIDTDEDNKIVFEDEIKILSLEEAKLIWKAQKIFLSTKSND